MLPSRLPFQTLAHSVEISGIGLHSGCDITARLQPGPHLGVVFVRTDLPGAPEIPAAAQYVAGTTHATTLEANGASVSTTEHLLAALWALGVTHCRVALNGPEVPILDGSAAGWCALIRSAGIVPVDTAGQRPVYMLREPVWVSDRDASVVGLPHPCFRLTAAVEYGVDYVGPQVFDLEVNATSFEAQLAPARTFTLEAWIEPLRAQGLIKGGSTENAIVLGPTAPSSVWRSADELARHKALDVVGDVALLLAPTGGILCAHLVAVRAGHGLHRCWMDVCLARHSLAPA